MRLAVIIGSTRPGRIGPVLANWFLGSIRQTDGVLAELIDLADLDRPIFSEPHHPRLKKCEHAHTKKISDTIGAFHADVPVTPEYNHGPPHALVNGLSYLNSEWAYKPRRLSELWRDFRGASPCAGVQADAPGVEGCSDLRRCCRPAGVRTGR